MAAQELQGQRVHITVNEPWRDPEAGSDRYEGRVDAVAPANNDGRVTTCLLSVDSGIRGLEESDSVVASVRHSDASMADLLEGAQLAVNCAPVPAAVRGTPEALVPAAWWRGGAMLMCSIKLERERT